MCMPVGQSWLCTNPWRRFWQKIPRLTPMSAPSTLKLTGAYHSDTHIKMMHVNLLSKLESPALSISGSNFIVEITNTKLLAQWLQHTSHVVSTNESLCSRVGRTDRKSVICNQWSYTYMWCTVHNPWKHTCIQDVRYTVSAWIWEMGVVPWLFIRAFNSRDAWVPSYSWYDYYGGRSVSTAGAREATCMAQLALGNQA